VRVQMDGALQARYWYDAGGRRVKLEEGADSILHVYSGAEYNLRGERLLYHQTLLCARSGGPGGIRTLPLVEISPVSFPFFLYHFLLAFHNEAFTRTQSGLWTRSQCSPVSVI
jgi:hypothetical protein